MPPQIATVLFAVGIAGLFWLDRDDSVRVSKPLWLPVIWLSINGSRSVSAWLGMGPEMEIPGQLPATSLLDQLVAGTLILLGAIVLIRRRRDVRGLLKASWPIVLYYSYCLLSLLWSDFPGWGFKRWVRGLGDLVMVLIVATDAQPTAALRRLFSRVGFVLLPASVLLINYYVELSSNWDPWGTARQYTGVTTNKNMLGNLVFVVTLGALWQTLSLVRDRKEPNRARRLLAQCILLGFGIKLLFTAHSATSGACFVLGAGLMLATTSLPLIRRRPAAVHALVLAIVLGGCLIEFLGGRAIITEAVGRKADLSGRTEIWGIVIPMVNWMGGAGFETFWVGPRVARVSTMAGGWGMTNEAHNGYIEVYLNLGWLGLVLIALILGQGYRMTVSTFRRDSALGALLTAYVVTAVAYNISEAGFRILSLEWFFVLLSVVAASRATGVSKRARQSHLSLSQASWRSELPSPLETTDQQR
jgi:exopolysaccharide production protein ExoQ